MTTFAQTLRHRVSIQQHVVGSDAIGQPVTTWQEFAPAWADIRNLRGIEAIKAGAVTSEVQASIRMRYRTDLTAAMRLVHGATTYEVLAVLPDEAGQQHVDLVCKVLS